MDADKLTVKKYILSKKGVKLTPSKYQDLLDDLSGISDSDSDSESDESFNETPSKDEEPQVSIEDKIDYAEPTVSTNHFSTDAFYGDSILDMLNSESRPKVSERDDIHENFFNTPKSNKTYIELNKLDYTPTDIGLSNKDFETPTSGVEPIHDVLSSHTVSNSTSNGSSESILTSNLPSVQNFIGKPGLTIPIDQLETPLEFFQLFINKNILDYLTYETNLYAFQTKVTKKSSYKNWRPIKLVDMAQYLGLNILFGIFKLPRKNMYWSLGKAYSSDLVRSCMSFNRYQEINTFFHAFNNKAISPDANDRLIKVRTLVEYFINRFQKMYTPEKNLSLDEGIMPHKGRLSFKTYQPKKPESYGVKMYILTEAVSGYVYKFSVYTG